MKLSKKDWNRLADWIKENTCGCVYSTFNGEDLKKDMEEEK